MGELEIFANRIKQLRKSLGMTQKDFSEYIGVKQQTLSGYERGIMKPPLDIAKNIAEKCNISIDWLCGLSDKMNNSDEIKTYGDAIRLLLKLEAKIDIYVSYQWNKGDCIARVDFSSDNMQNFIKEWQKIKQVHDSSTIDDEIYNLWAEKILKKYDTLPVVEEGWKAIEKTDFDITLDEPPQ